jgi:hypothetical protein
VLRILFIFACIWLVLSLFGRQLLMFVFKQGAKSSVNEQRRKQKRSKQDKGTSIDAVIPDDVGKYVDFTEIKS